MEWILLFPSTKPRGNFNIPLHCVAGSSWQSKLAREPKPGSQKPQKTSIVVGIWTSCTVIRVLEISKTDYSDGLYHGLIYLNLPSLQALCDSEKGSFQVSQLSILMIIFLKNVSPIGLKFKSFLAFPYATQVLGVFHNWGRGETLINKACNKGWKWFLFYPSVKFMVLRLFPAPGNLACVTLKCCLMRNSDRIWAWPFQFHLQLVGIFLVTDTFSQLTVMKGQSLRMFSGQEYELYVSEVWFLEDCRIVKTPLNWEIAFQVSFFFPPYSWLFISVLISKICCQCFLWIAIQFKAEC